MPLPKYLMCTNKAELPGPVILSTYKPFHVGKIWTYQDRDAYAEKIGNNNNLYYAVVPSYMIVITYLGDIEGKITFNPAVMTPIENILQEMVDFYYREKIEPSLAFYRKRYSIK